MPISSWPSARAPSFSSRAMTRARDTLIGSPISTARASSASNSGLGGANVALIPGADLNPAAIVPVLKIGLQRFDAPNNLTVDAAKINPA